MANDGWSQALHDQLDKVLAGPLPGTGQERQAWLEEHLRQTLEELRKGGPKTPAYESDEDVAAAIADVRGLVADAAGRVGLAGAEGARLSQCDQAALLGVAAITYGAAALGPPGAFVGFGLGVYELLTHC